MSQVSVDRKPLGWWLLHERVLDVKSLESALEDQRAQGGRLGDVLVASGRVRKADLFRCLALQVGLPFVSLHGTPPARQALDLLTAAEARELRVIPLAFRHEDGEKVLRVAVGPPERRYLARRLEDRTHMRVDAVLCDPAELAGALEFYESLGTPMMRPVNDDAPADEPAFLPEEVPAADPHIQALVDADLAAMEGVADAQALQRALEASEVLDLEAAGAVEDLEDLPSSPPPVSAPSEETTAGADAATTLLALQERVHALESEVHHLRAEAEAAVTLRGRLSLVEAQLEHLLVRLQPPEPAHTEIGVLLEELQGADVTPPDGVPAVGPGRPEPVALPQLAVPFTAEPAPEPSRTTTDELALLLELAAEPGPASLDAVVPEPPGVPATPPPLPRRRSTPFAALIAEAAAVPPPAGPTDELSA
ncbi:MAG: hypothetical protein HY904_17215 [Deltaproteobacteria bacterium]|nr:hypothetical protein [Deltaproteobacteria bacterium]